MTRVRELLDIPDQIRKMDFTVTLTEGVAKPAQTIDTYVVTPRIADAFDQALNMIGAALRDGGSLGAYLHGSFGSGKSHFMAVLSLLLANEEVAWSRPEFHDLRQKYDWVGDKKILELQIHMLGKDSLEEAIYPAYLEYLEKHHRDAAIPGIFADEELFDNARSLLDSMGEDRFFAPMNPTDQGGDDAWGDVATEAVWTRESFEQAASSTDRDERAKLLDALVTTHLKAFKSSAKAYRDLDEGLWVLSHHAADLGYHGVVLFLDELILRMSMGASQPQWLNDMVMSMVKLKESTHSDRAIPFVSFIARQRALKEMVGDQLAGPDAHRLEHALSLARGRFREIELPNEELPAIVEKRVLTPKDDDARQQIDKAFEQIQKSASSGSSNAWATLTTGKHDAKDFRRLYPFSPSLVETLVDLSSSLQRQRTSIKLLTEMLIEHIDDLDLGSLVGVGDLFDLLASGDESAEGIMRERFRAAVELYKHQFLPLIRSERGTDNPEKCQRLRDDHKLRLGCANCAQRACRNDNRIVKTLLVAALTPNSEPLRNLTVSRLVQLNHGQLKSRIPGYEQREFTTKLRKWVASGLHQIQLGNQDDPTVSVELHGVDLKPIMEQARSVDSSARRQAKIRSMLFEEMGVGRDVEVGKDDKVTWRGSVREGHIRFGNIRLLAPNQLRCPDDHDWRLLVDFPFDDDGHGPEEDEAVLENFRNEHGGSWTLVWLPSFFSEGVNKLLGELVILGHILDSGDPTRQGYIKHLSPDQQNMAVNSMTSLQRQKCQQVLEAMRKAYGLASAKDDDEQLDPGRRMTQHLHTLQPGLEHVRPQLAADLSHARDAYVHALLEERYPKHPRFTKVVKGKKIGDVLRFFDDLIDRDDKKIALDKQALEDMRGLLGELGFVRVTENAAILREDATLQALENKRMQKSVEHPTAGQIAAWFDEDGKVGLKPEAMAMVIRAYARAKSRTLLSGGAPYTFEPGKPIPDHVVLERPELPTHSEWKDGLELAGYLGIALRSKALHGDNLKRLERDLGKQLTDLGKPVDKLPAELRTWTQALGLPEDTPRLQTAHSAQDLFAGLQGKPAVDQVRFLAAFTAKTSPGALGRSVGSAKDTAAVLGNTLTLGVFQQLLPKRDGNPEAAEILDEVAKTLRQDELNIGLATRIRQLAERGQQLLVEKTSPPPPAEPGAKTLWSQSISAKGSAEIIAALEDALAQVRSAAEGNVDVALRGNLSLTGKPEA
ncbi:MAG: hypothetical protein ACE37F_37120 [Nannocystaceae bacterium]|nr:hypothetical protein [bacterium]